MYEVEILSNISQALNENNRLQAEMIKMLSDKFDQLIADINYYAKMKVQ